MIRESECLYQCLYHENNAYNSKVGIVEQVEALFCNYRQEYIGKWRNGYIIKPEKGASNDMKKTMPIMDYIEKIALLEKSVGHKTNYKMLEPFIIKIGAQKIGTPVMVATPKGIIIGDSNNNYFEYSRAAQIIAKFIGLGNYNFVVMPCAQKDHVAGKINLKFGDKDVIIEVSDKILQSESVLAVLAHEISHKYLHIHSIWCRTQFPNYENEVLTDITAVFLGLGKLMLNGRYYRESYSHGRVTTTEEIKIGYLDEHQLAFVYYLTCTMRGIPSNEYKNGLNLNSLHALEACEKSYSYYLQMHNDYKIQNKLKISLKNTQDILSEVNSNFNYLRYGYVETVASFLLTTNRRLSDISLKIGNQDDEEFDPCLRFLNKLRAEQEIHEMISRLDDVKLQVLKHNDHLERITRYIQAIEQGSLFCLFKESLILFINKLFNPQWTRKYGNNKVAQ